MMRNFTVFLLFIWGVFALPVLAADSAQSPPPPMDNAPATEPKSVPKSGSESEINLVDTVKALSQFLTEEEVQLVYDYLWDSSVAALKGSPEEATLPPELTFKLAILQKRIVKEGGYYLDVLARKMEKDLARWRDQLLTPGPPVPYNLPNERVEQATPKR